MERIFDTEFNYSALDCQVRTYSHYVFLIFPSIVSYIVLIYSEGDYKYEVYTDTVPPHTLFSVDLISEEECRDLVIREAESANKHKEEYDLGLFRSILIKYPEQSQSIIKEFSGDETV